MRIPPGVTSITLQLRAGGANGAVSYERTLAPQELEMLRQPDGSYRVESEAGTNIECDNPPGDYALVLLDGASRSVIGASRLTVAP